MNHFISIVFDNKPLNEDLDVAVIAATSSANIGLLENEFEYEMYESTDSTYVITIPTLKSLNEDEAHDHAQSLADKLFDAGFVNFDIEYSVLESQLNEATLRRGSRGPEVQALQQQLGIPADGIFGPQTEQALRAFQQQAGIQVDGIAGGQTQAALAAGGAPRNAGTTRPSTAPFQPGQGSTTQAPPTAAPQTSPRPQARPEQPTTAPQTSPRPQARPQQPAATGGLDDTAARAEISRQLAAQRAAADARRGTGAGPTSRSGPRGQTPAPTTITSRPVGQVDPNDPRGNQIAPPRGAAVAAPVAQTTAPTQTTPPAEETPPVARTNPRSGVVPPRAAPAAVTPPTAGEVPAVDTTPAARPVTGIGTQAQTVPSAARAAGQPGRAGMAGDETSALDAIAADRAAGRLPDVPAGAGPRGVPADGPTAIAGPGQAARPGPRPALADPQAAAGAAVAADNPQAPGSNPDAVADIGPVTTTTAEPAAAQGAADAAIDARMGSDASAAPAAGAAQALYQAMKGGTGWGTDEEGIAQALQGIRSQQEWDQVKAAYDGDLLADLAGELNTRDYQRYVSSVLQAAGIQESVPARPKGAFMFRERAEWDELFGSRYNKDGSPRARKPVFESRVMDEETYHGNEFYEAYGEMWFNEDDIIDEAEYQGRKVKLGKPMRGDVKKFKVYVKNPKGNVVKVNFGDPDMKIKKSNPARRRSFRARHNCDNPGPRHKARYWSCRKW